MWIGPKGGNLCCRVWRMLHEYAKISHDYVNWTRRGNLCYRARRILEVILHEHMKFRTTMQNGQESSLLLLLNRISHSCVKMMTLLQNDLSSYKMVILILNFRFVNSKGSKIPMRSCQVSTWPWPINKTWISHVKSFWTLLIIEFFRNSLLIEFSIFFHFLTGQTYLVRSNL